MRKWIFLLGSSMMFSLNAGAMEMHGFYGGLALNGHNALFRTTESPTGSRSLLGTIEFPFILGYAMPMGSGKFFFRPQLDWNLMGTQGDGGKSTSMHFRADFGAPFASGDFDWILGTGIKRSTFAGSGGIRELSNGTGTSNFANPARSVTTTNLTVNLGMGLDHGPLRYEGGLVAQGFLSSLKRSFDAYFAMSYRFGGR